MTSSGPHSSGAGEAELQLRSVPTPACSPPQQRRSDRGLWEARPRPRGHSSQPDSSGDVGCGYCICVSDPEREPRKIPFPPWREAPGPGARQPLVAPLCDLCIMWLASGSLSASWRGACPPHRGGALHKTLCEPRKYEAGWFTERCAAISACPGVWSPAPSQTCLCPALAPG